METDVTDLQFKQELITKDVVKRNNENILGDVRKIRNNVPFTLFQESNKKHNFNDSIENIIQPTVLSGVFFSRKNIDNIQEKIIKGIKKILNYDR